MKNYLQLIILTSSCLFLSCCKNSDIKQFPTKIYSSDKVKHFKFEKQPFDTINEGILRKLVFGDNLQQTHVIVEKGFIIPKHKHVSEQMSTILKGKFKATVFYKNKTEETILNAGDVFLSLQTFLISIKP